MIMIGIVFLGILSSIFGQVALFRLIRFLSNHGIASITPLFSLVLFPVGIVCTGVAMYSLSLTSDTIVTINIPFVLIVCMMLILGLYALWILTPILGEEGPTSMILRTIRKSGTSMQEVIKECAKDEMMEKRMQSLIDSGLITTIRERYVITPKGNMTAKIIYWYFGLIGWVQSG